MKKYMIGSRALRMTFLSIAVLIMAGLWLGGLNQVY